MTVYAHAARWPKDIYAATLQPIFLVGGVLSFAVKVLTGAADFTAVTAGGWGAGAAGMLAGMVAGKRIAPLVSPARGYSLALALAVFGGATVLARGIVGAIFSSVEHVFDASNPCRTRLLSFSHTTNAGGRRGP